MAQTREFPIDLTLGTLGSQDGCSFTFYLFSWYCLGFGTQGLMVARHSLYHTLSSLCFSYFSDRVSHLYLAQLWTPSQRDRAFIE
jgi:hypothetical protein